MSELDFSDFLDAMNWEHEKHFEPLKLQRYRLEAWKSDFNRSIINKQCNSFGWICFRTRFGKENTNKPTYLIHPKHGFLASKADENNITLYHWYQTNDQPTGICFQNLSEAVEQINQLKTHPTFNRI